jgi:hypothetical protein
MKDLGGTPAERRKLKLIPGSDNDSKKSFIILAAEAG